MNKYLMDAVLNCLCFLELSSENVISIDDAVHAIEDTAAFISSMNPGEIAELVAYAHQLGEREMLSNNLERAEFLLNIEENIGL